MPRSAKTVSACVVEPLEHRRLLAADLASASIKSGLLRVRGTRGDDVIRLALSTLSPQKLDAFATGDVPLGTFDLAAITKGIRVDAGNGNDRVIVDENLGLLTLPTNLRGGNGDDFLAGGSGVDTILGDRGADELHGSGAADDLRGGNDNDRLFGEAGDDRLDGGSGDDILDGGDDADFLRGNKGNDALAGAAGADTLLGDAGDDILDGGDGDDTLSGGKGNDRLAGSIGADLLRGDAGVDEIDGGDGDDQIDGGKGIDRNRGGAGADTFVAADAPAEVLERDAGDRHVGVDPVLVWADEFDGPAIDLAKWELGTNAEVNHDGGINDYDPREVSVEGGSLVIRSRVRTAEELAAAPAGTPLPAYVSGRAAMLLPYRYGRIEVRAKVPATQGFWNAVWLLPSDGSWPPEIDVVESLGAEPNRAYMIQHFGTAKKQQHDQSHFDGPDFTADYHVFTLDWEPGRVRWLIDGVERKLVTKNIPRQEMFLILNTSVGGLWPGPPDATTVFPQFFQVDYVRLYDLPRRK